MDQPRVCPHCGSDPVNKVIYGLPSGPLPPRHITGGCIIGPDGPDWICNTCTHQWQTPDSFRATAWAEYETRNPL